LNHRGIVYATCPLDCVFDLIEEKTKGEEKKCKTEWGEKLRAE
jgi:hypothetical protein